MKGADSARAAPAARREGSRITQVNYFDVWLPSVAKPRSGVVRAGEAVDRRAMGSLHAALSQRDATPRGRAPDRAAAALSKQANFQSAATARNPSRCHRSLLGELMRDQRWDNPPAQDKATAL